MNNRMTYLTTTAMLVITAVMCVAAPAQAANYTTVPVRVEAPDKTIMDTTVYVSDAGCIVTDSDGVDHALTGDNALCALKTLSLNEGMKFVVKDSAYGLYLDSIETYQGSSQYWTYYVNDVEGAVGLADYDLQENDQLLFVYGDYGATAPLRVRVSATQQLTKKAIEATVEYKSGSTYVPMENAVVHFGKTAVTTNAKGKAVFTPTKAGTVSVYATAVGYTKTPVKKVVVHTAVKKRQSVNFEQRQKQSRDGVAYIKKQMNAQGIVNNSQSETEWSAMALATIGQKNDTLIKAVRAYKPKTSDGTSEIARHILALEAIGDNSKKSGSINFIDRLVATKKNNQYGESQYCNDDIFAGLALLSADVKATDDDVKDAVNASLACQNADGGFGYAVDSDSEVDTTASWIMLAAQVRTENKYYKTLINEKYKKATRFLRSAQNLDGGFGYELGAVSNTSSTAWATMAFSAQGLEAGSVMKNSQSGFTYLKKTYSKSGAYTYDVTRSNSVESLNTAYAIIAQARKAFPVNQ